jgi:hypothetical protein
MKNFNDEADKTNYKQKWIFLIGLGLIVLDFPFVSGELTDKSIKKIHFYLYRYVGLNQPWATCGPLSSLERPF